MKGSSGNGGNGQAYVRHASHAGSWYSNDASTLSGQLEGWLEAARADGDGGDGAAAAGPVRAIIAPHAGYGYSGPTAAFAYMNLDAAHVRRIFILGPSHHVYLKACAVSGASVCETPVGDLKVDEAVRAELLGLGRGRLFQPMAQRVDEDEHSIEMHLPYVAQVLKGQPEARGVTIVPIMVGAIDPEQEREYGEALAPYLQDPANFFIISSDFCHWGSRFRYQPFDAAHGPGIGDYVEWLDRQGMALIQRGDPEGFQAYLQEHRNTICGRHPIAVFMRMAVAHRARTGRGLAVRFVRYAQSSRCRSKQDSSVSYASAVAKEEERGGGNGGTL